jgi:lysylphosphatidylglycerol synthetase-like protein (DUF2156 family)
MLRAYVHVAPASVTLALIVLATAIITGTLWSAATAGGAALVWAAGVPTTIHAGFWWTPLTALFVPEDPVQAVISVVLALTLLAVAERLLGTTRVVVAFLVTGIVGITLGVLGQWAASTGEILARATEFDVTLDPTIGIVGALIAASAFSSTLWRRRIRLLTFAVVVMFVLYNGDQNNLYRLIAALLGLALGALLRRGRLHRMRRSSHAETRNLVAAIVAITAVGPLAALLPPGGLGPLSFVAALFLHQEVDATSVLAACRAVDTSNCRDELAAVSVQGVGPLLLTLLPLVLLIVTAIGLRRGRHFAWLLGIVVNIAMIVLPFTALPEGTVDVNVDSFDALVPAIKVLLWVLAAFLVPFASIVLLIATRRQFQIRAPRDAVVRFTILVVVSFALLSVAYLIAGLATLTSFVPEAGLGDVFMSTLRRFVPSGFESVLGPVIVPTSPFALFLYQWVGPVFWTIFITGTMRLYRATSTGRTLGDELHFRELLHAGGGGTLGFMGTWPGNVYWFSEDGEAAVAYRVINGVAITLSDPVCRPERAEQTIIDFIGFCDANSWTPAFYSIHGSFLPVFESLGWQAVSVGEETLMHPQTFDMQGKPWQKVRQAHNRGVKERISTLWTTWDELAPLQQSQIVSLSEQWVSEKELPELGFTLGGMAELKDPEVRLYLAYDRQGDLQAVTSWLPSWRDDRIIGYTLDFMRRVDRSVPGIMEFVIASAAQRMRREGVEVLSLSGAPLATKPANDLDTKEDEEGEPAIMDRLLTFLAKTLEPAYGFASLFSFKSKFNPTYETLWMAYPDAVALPAIGNAVGRAYLPDANGKDYVALARTLRDYRRDGR